MYSKERLAGDGEERQETAKKSDYDGGHFYGSTLARAEEPYGASKVSGNLNVRSIPCAWEPSDSISQGTQSRIGFEHFALSPAPVQPLA